MRDDSAVTFHVQTIDNTGIETMVWDDFQQQFGHLNELNLPQGGQDEIAYFDENGIKANQQTNISNL